MAQALPERASSGNTPRGTSSGPQGKGDRPLTDGHLAALLGGADTDLLAAISILALSGMRLDEMRRLRVAQCGRGFFRVGECAANLGAREVPVHSALAGTVLRLTRGRAGDAFLIGDGADFGRAPSLIERRFDACRRAAVGMAGPPLSVHGLRRWFVRTALDAEQPPGVVVAVIGHFRPAAAEPRPTWGQRCACVEAVRLPEATLWRCDRRRWFWRANPMGRGGPADYSAAVPSASGFGASSSLAGAPARPRPPTPP